MKKFMLTILIAFMAFNSFGQYQKLPLTTIGGVDYYFYEGVGRSASESFARSKAYDAAAEVYANSLSRVINAVSGSVQAEYNSEYREVFDKETQNATSMILSGLIPSQPQVSKEYDENGRVVYKVVAFYFVEVDTYNKHLVDTPIRNLPVKNEEERKEIRDFVLKEIKNNTQRKVQEIPQK